MYSPSPSGSAVFSAGVLKIDPVAESSRIEDTIRKIVLAQLKRKGAIVGVSGGIDSAVVLALCTRALGQERVVALLMPEAESSADSIRLGRTVAEALGVRSLLEDITPMLQAARCYQRRDDAIRRVIPEYGEGYKCKIVAPPASQSFY